MTNELIELVEWLERQDSPWHHKKAAMLRKLAEQKPVAWMYAPKDGSIPPTPWGRRWPEHALSNWIEEPLYAAPVPAITAEQKAEAIYAWCAGREWIEPTEDGPVCMIPAALLPDLADYLDKIGGQ